MKQNTDQHTPGPWVASAYKEGDGTLHTVWTEEQADRLSVLVARTCFAPASEANARLIAASPDLLQSCIDLLAIVRIQNGNLHEDVNVVQDRALAAIAKAQPEQKEGM